MKHIAQSRIFSLFEKLQEKRKAPAKDDTLYALLSEAQKELSAYRRNLMFADTEALTDMYIYALKAAEIRYDHILNLIRKAELAS